MDLTERLLNPETVEEALGEAEILFVLEQSRATNDAWRVPAFNAIRKLHQRLATAKAEGAAEELDKVAQQMRMMPKLDKFTDAAFSSAADVIDRRAAAIRKGLAKEGK